MVAIPDFGWARCACKYLAELEKRKGVGSMIQIMENPWTTEKVTYKDLDITEKIVETEYTIKTKLLCKGAEVSIRNEEFHPIGTYDRLRFLYDFFNMFTIETYWKEYISNTVIEYTKENINKKGHVFKYNGVSRILLNGKEFLFTHCKDFYDNRSFEIKRDEKQTTSCLLTPSMCTITTKYSKYGAMCFRDMIESLSKGKRTCGEIEKRVFYFPIKKVLEMVDNLDITNIVDL